MARSSYLSRIANTARPQGSQLFPIARETKDTSAAPEMSPPALPSVREPAPRTPVAAKALPSPVSRPLDAPSDVASAALDTPQAHPIGPRDEQAMHSPSPEARTTPRRIDESPRPSPAPQAARRQNVPPAIMAQTLPARTSRAHSDPPTERKSARIQIGTIEVRTRPEPAAPSPRKEPAPPARLPQPSASQASPWSGGYGWRFGLVLQ
jgi:hypothetical protein